MYRILVVDDEEIERNGIEYLLLECGFPLRILKAAHGRDALRLLSDQQVDILLTDIRMPFMDGLELSEKARELYPELMILILSSYGDFTYTQKAIQVHVDDYLLKPIIPEDFQRTISAALKELERRSKNELRKIELLDQYHIASDYKKEQILGRLLDGGYGEEAPGEAEVDRRAVQRAIDLISSSYFQDITVEWLSQQVYLSPGYLGTLFKKKTGKTVLQYLTTCRMLHAKKLLKETNMKIVDICRAVGYDNASYFCMLFRKYYGITAMQIREGFDAPKEDPHDE